MNLRNDAENKELYILGDVNCNSSYLTNSFLKLLVTEPTRVTPVSKTLIDLCSTNSQKKVTNSAVIHLGISDHSLDHSHDRNYPQTIEMRQFKHLKIILSDLEQMPWSNVDLCSDSNDRCQEWKQMFVSFLDKHVPRNLK